METISKAMGDEDASLIRVTSLGSKGRRITWVNESLVEATRGSDGPVCPSEEVKKVRSIILDRDGAAKQDFVRELRAGHVEVSEFRVRPMGPCLADATPTHPGGADADVDENHFDRDEIDLLDNPSVAGATEGDQQDDYLVTFVAPAVLIAAMLVVAALVAGCLYRRRRYAKMAVAGDRTFVHRGIPIIFAEELDDPNGAPLSGSALLGDPQARPPAIMKEEKPPLPPPQYSQGGVGDLPPHGGEAPNYQPPPPFTQNPQRNPSRPNMPPAYRKPPTYVPP